jgi:hypothetical protein
MYSAADLPKEGLPHSDIRGSTIARISPRLFAACHVLHRLLAPRHPPNALVSLTIHSPQRPHAVPNRAQTYRCRTASLTLTNYTSIPRFTCQRSTLARTSLSRRGSLGSGPQQGPEVPAEASPMSDRPKGSLAGHRERRAEPDDPAGSLVQVGRNQGTSAPSVTHYP